MTLAEIKSDVLTPAEYAAVMRLQVSTAWRHCRKGVVQTLPRRKGQRGYRIPKAFVEGLLAGESATEPTSNVTSLADYKRKAVVL